MFSLSCDSKPSQTSHLPIPRAHVHVCRYVFITVIYRYPLKVVICRYLIKRILRDIQTWNRQESMIWIYLHVHLFCNYKNKILFSLSCNSKPSQTSRLPIPKTHPHICHYAFITIMYRLTPSRFLFVGISTKEYYRYRET